MLLRSLKFTPMFVVDHLQAEVSVDPYENKKDQREIWLFSLIWAAANTETFQQYQVVYNKQENPISKREVYKLQTESGMMVQLQQAVNKNKSVQTASIVFLCPAY